MSKAGDLGSSAARSTFFLGMGLLFGNTISSLFMFIIARILTPQGYGLYSVAGVPTSIAAIFRDWGIFIA
ncbi:MAG: oligosaccharide flippase family protein, partial [Candidatus Njordarchaeales archaeon]